MSNTRAKIQDEMRIGNDKCDNCMLWTGGVLAYWACVCNTAACAVGMANRYGNAGIPGESECRQGARLCSQLAHWFWCACAVRCVLRARRRRAPHSRTWLGARAWHAAV